MWQKKRKRDGKVMVGVSTWMRKEQYDKVSRQAKFQGISVNQWIVSAVNIVLSQYGIERKP